MEIKRKGDKVLTILGFCAGNTPLVLELAKETLNFNVFDIVKNVEVNVPDSIYQRNEFDIQVYEAKQYKFDSPDLNVQFGVLDAHIKYILYHYFMKEHMIDKKRYTNIIHPSSYLAASSIHASGFMLDPMSVISTSSSMGFGVTIKRSSSVGHHVTIGDFVTINPGVTISGYVNIGEGTTIGAGATVIHNINIGKYSLVGAGSVVTKDIPDGVVAFGNPCKVVRTYERWQKAFDIVNKRTSETRSLNT